MALRLVSHHNNLWGCDIIKRMQHPVHDEVFMEEALAAYAELWSTRRLAK